MDTFDELLDGPFDFEPLGGASYDDPFEEVIRFAMEQEKAEDRFYTQLAERVENADVKRMMLAHAQDERTHLDVLQNILERHKLPEGNRRYPDPDMKMADYLVTPEKKSGPLGYQDALILAIKMEQAGMNLYQDLAALAPDDETRRTFHFLAEQERKHKNLLEQEYDDNFFEED